MFKLMNDLLRAKLLSENILYFRRIFFMDTTSSLQLNCEIHNALLYHFTLWKSSDFLANMLSTNTTQIPDIDFSIQTSMTTIYK